MAENVSASAPVKEPRVSEGQQKPVLDFMKQHLQLALRSSELGPGFTLVDRRRLWQQLADALNVEGPVVKTVDQWQDWWRKQQAYEAGRDTTAIAQDQRHGNDGICHLVNGVAHGRLRHAYVLLATNAPLEASGAEEPQRAQHLRFCGKATGSNLRALGSLASSDGVKLVAQATHCSFGQTKMLPELFLRQLFKCIT
ncbi:hypothetical protein HPB49_023473 [Dermacentor silvarum]|uniref:Uncharacterized protein n=1 Tax=Dermacentor silvarum TaxID=543639 RepID=A0ACB8E3P8_DERSI|nr:hypothetical protein HPB49_023473 [Dermacentor silvarum]